MHFVEQYPAYRRPIMGIERLVHAKLSAPMSSVPTCSFCGLSSDDVQLLAQVSDDARFARSALKNPAVSSGTMLQIECEVHPNTSVNADVRRGFGAC